MAEGRWIWRAVFLGMVMLMIFLRILPMPIEPGRLPGPDLVMCLCCAWVLRRPDHLPAILIAGVVFLEDMLLMRPPGLWAAILLLGTEFLRRRASRDMPILQEWGMVSMAILVMVLANRLIHAMVLLPQPGLGMTLLHAVMSIIAYPVVVVLLKLAFRFGPAGGTDLDAYGRRS